MTLKSWCSSVSYQPFRDVKIICFFFWQIFFDVIRKGPSVDPNFMRGNLFSLNDFIFSLILFLLTISMEAIGRQDGCSSRTKVTIPKSG